MAAFGNCTPFGNQSSQRWPTLAASDCMHIQQSDLPVAHEMSLQSSYGLRCFSPSPVGGGGGLL